MGLVEATCVLPGRRLRWLGNYNLARKQRANTVGGVVVPETSENAENGD
jgi:hypothetical protein